MPRWQIRHLIWIGIVVLTLPASAQAQSAGLPILTQIDQILALTPIEARRGYPVRLEAIVTYSDPEWGLLYVQDKTGGIATERLATPLVLEPGDLLAIEGSTGAGPFSPVVASRAVNFLKKVSLPQARWIRMFEMNSGGADGQWVELSGVVQSEEAAGDRLRLELASGLNRCSVWIQKPARYRNQKLTDSRVRVRGVAAAEFDVQHRLNGFQLHVSTLDDLKTVGTPPVSAFNRPVMTGREVLGPMPPLMAEHRLHVRGVVTMQWPGRMVFLRDPSGGVCLQTVSSPRLQIGDLVEAVGFRSLGSLAPQLEAAVVRSVGRSEVPEPLPLSPGPDAADRSNYDLVQLEARLVNIRMTPPDQVCLALQAGDRGWNVYLQATHLPSNLSSLLPGSRLLVTGVAHYGEAPRRRDRDLVLWLRSPADIQVLAVPLSVRQLALLWSTGVLGVVLLGALPVGWARQRHRRRLQQKLDESKRHLHQHVEERKRMGQDLHDNIMQSIYAVGLGLEDCRRLVQKSPEQAEERLVLATRALNDVLHDVRQFIGGLEPRVLSGAELNHALTSLAMTTGESSARFVIQADPNATHFLTPHQATQLLNVAREAMSNSLRHAKANRTLVAVGLAQDHVRLEITDDGVGFDPKTLGTAGNGLRNVAARAQDLGARCEIISACGQGTRVVLDLPPLSTHVAPL